MLSLHRPPASGRISVWLERRTASCGQYLPIPHTRTFLISASRRLQRHGFDAGAAVNPSLAPVSAPKGFSSASPARNQKESPDIDTIVSVLEASATKRDAKGYLQKYTSIRSASLRKVPEFRHGKPQSAPQERKISDPSQANVAVVKLRDPQSVNDDVLLGVAKTLFQLRVLGLLSVVIVDCGLEASRNIFADQCLRLSDAIDSFSRPSSKIIENVFLGQTSGSPDDSSTASHEMHVEDQGRLEAALQDGFIPVIPSLVSPDEISTQRPADPNQLTITLVSHLSGVPSSRSYDAGSASKDQLGPQKLASVERIIVLDPLGGTPVSGRPGASHRFVNLEQEYDGLMRHLAGPEDSQVASNERGKASAAVHASNLKLVKEALSLLPSTSSAIVTTPMAAGYAKSSLSSSSARSRGASSSRESGLDGSVKAKKHRNPILYNLLTDKPVFSSSLPVQRILDNATDGDEHAGSSSAATLVKRGMPVTVYPDPRVSGWMPPPPGEPRLRLTDASIDLPRLIFLIEDSFGRRLDAEHYLDRVKDNLAGIIIAGEYEGGAILTWETPDGLTNEEAYSQGRLVPYLDKFAVLKSRQGSGGVADIVFNAMVKQCFPKGVCWRSRKNNPVNKWYFERSAGTNKLSDSNWTMFWTTMGQDHFSSTLKDYESVCRHVEPSWADNKHILD